MLYEYLSKDVGRIIANLGSVLYTVFGCLVSIYILLSVPLPYTEGLKGYNLHFSDSSSVRVLDV